MSFVREAEPGTEDTASSLGHWSVLSDDAPLIPPTIEEGEPWQVRFKIPGHTQSIMKSFPSVPELTELESSIEELMGHVGLLEWHLFLDEVELTNQNTVWTLRRTAARRSEGQARQVQLQVRVHKAEQQGSNETGMLKEKAKWPSWTMVLLFSNLLTLAFIALLVLQFHHPQDVSAAAAFDELLVNQSMSEKAAASAAARIEHLERLAATQEANCKLIEMQVAEKAYDDGLQEGLRRQAASEDSRQYTAAASEACVGMRGPTFDVLLVNQTICGALPEAAAATELEENVTDKGLQKADDRGAPGSPWIVGGARAVVRGLWYVIKVAATLGSLLVCIGLFVCLLCGCVDNLYKAEVPLWFDVPMAVASVAALVALGVMSWSTILKLFLEVEQQHSFSISLAACLTCMCAFVIISAAENDWPVAFAGAVVGVPLFEAAWIRLAEDLQNQEGQRLSAIASAVLLGVMAWLWCWTFTFGQAWEKKCRPRRAVVIHHVLCTLLAGCFFALFSSSMFTLEKEDRPPLFAVMMILWLPLFLASVAMALINVSARLKVGLEDVLKAMLKAPPRREEALLIGSLFFAPMCFFMMLRLQDAWQWLATTILTLIGLLLAYVMQDWLKKPCW